MVRAMSAPEAYSRSTKTLPSMGEMVLNVSVMIFSRGNLNAWGPARNTLNCGEPFCSGAAFRSMIGHQFLGSDKDETNHRQVH
jgi:hypothetical protein